MPDFQFFHSFVSRMVFTQANANQTKYHGFNFHESYYILEFMYLKQLTVQYCCSDEGVSTVPWYFFL